MTDYFEYVIVGAMPQSNADLSDALARNFSRGYARQYTVPTEVLCVEQRGVDAILRIDERDVAIEFAGYLQRDEYHDKEVADTAIRQAIADALKTDNFPPINLTLWWNHENRRVAQSGTSRDIAKMPDPQSRESFIRELRKLLRELIAGMEADGTKIIFRDKSIKHTQYRVECAQRFPCLAKHCSWISAELHDNVGWPSIESSSRPRFIGLDRNHLDRIVAEKHKKVGKYREQISEIELWLAIHADGYPPSRRLPEPHRDAAIQLIKDKASQYTNGFDAIWWVEDTAFVDAAKLYRAK